MSRIRIFDKDSSISPRDITDRLGISNVADYKLFMAFMDQCYVMLKNLVKSNNKEKYLYELIPNRIRAQAMLAVQFFNRKRNKYRKFWAEICRLEISFCITAKDLADDNGSSV